MIAGRTAPYIRSVRQGNCRTFGGDSDSTAEAVRTSVGLIPEPSTFVMLATAGLFALPLLQRQRPARALAATCER